MSPLFTAWELRGTYPKILKDDHFGEAARELFQNATDLLDRFIAEDIVEARGVYGFFPANQDGEDIVVEKDGETMRFACLRQQRLKAGDEQRQLSLVDFVAPKSMGTDYVGAFAVSTGFKLKSFVEACEAEHDDYTSILAKVIADRLAEAFAEYLHLQARKDFGYGLTEDLELSEMLKEKYLLK